MSEWVRLGSDSDFNEKIKLVQIGRTKIAVARLQGELFAFSGVCPHSFGPLHRAETDGTIITCPLHGWRFDLCDKGREIHGYRPLLVYEIKLEEGEVHVNLSTLPQPQISNGGTRGAV